MKSACLALALAACAVDDPLAEPACDEIRQFQIDRVELAADGTEMHALAFDLDHDGLVDNSLGALGAMLTRTFADVPLDLEARANAHLATDTAWRISVARCGETARRVAIGHDPDALVLAGELADGQVRAAGRGGFVPLIALFDGTGEASSLFAAAEHAEVQLDETGDALTGTLGFAIAGEVASPLVIHGMTRFLDAHLELGRLDFDGNGDGEITEAEVAASSFAQALLGTDLEIDGVESMSLGLRFHATPR